MEKFYITTPIYYINDKPHIGHAYTSVCADMLARYWRMQFGADQVHFLTGTDEHGAKIQQAADKEKMEPQAFADKVAATFQVTWDRLSISNNDFIRTTEQRHIDGVNEFLSKVKAAKTPLGNEAIFKGEYAGLYCIGCEKYLKDSDLDDQGCCKDHKKKPEMMKEENWFFKLSDYTQWLKKKLPAVKFASCQSRARMRFLVCLRLA
jgi:methionyl-tRNA synthetase